MYIGMQTIRTYDTYIYAVPQKLCRLAQPHIDIATPLIDTQSP